MDFGKKRRPDISIVMPCLDEEKTVGICVDEAWEFIQKNHLPGEVIVVDNGSKDDSAAVAKAHGAIVIKESAKGYGRAIRTGIKNSRGKVIVIGDCDTTYDFLHLEDFYEMLSSGGYDMVIGDRLCGRMQKGAMPLSHKWGVRFLSACARIRCKTDVRDFHCGLRGLTGEAAVRLPFQTEGMEFATEMILLAAKEGLRIGQVPVVLKRCQFERRSKLHTIRDGFRHLGYIFFGYSNTKK